MFMRLQNQLEWRASLLFSGRYEDLSREYILPLAVYLQDRLIALHTTEMVAEVFSSLHLALKARGVISSKPTIKAVELPRNGRFRAWVRWDETARDPATNRTAEGVYYFRETDQGTQSEMLDFGQLSVPEFCSFSPRPILLA